MIAYGATTLRQAVTAARLGHAGEPPREPPAGRLTLQQFVDREIDDARRARIDASLTDDGAVVRLGIRYVVLPCHVAHEHNVGWVLVRDDPGAIAHYTRLFGGAAHG
jgi:hypothetical protein